MLTLEEQIKNLETLLSQKYTSSEVKQILLKELESLKKELNAVNKVNR